MVAHPCFCTCAAFACDTQGSHKQEGWVMCANMSVLQDNSPNESF